jgi:hypothetical protein
LSLFLAGSFQLQYTSKTEKKDLVQVFCIPISGGNMENICDIDMINTAFTKLNFDLKVKPVGDGKKFIWLCAMDNSYALKISTSFMLKFEEMLKDSEDFKEDL